MNILEIYQEKSDDELRQLIEEFTSKIEKTLTQVTPTHILTMRKLGEHPLVELDEDSKAVIRLAIHLSQQIFTRELIEKVLFIREYGSDGDDENDSDSGTTVLVGGPDDKPGFVMLH